MRTPIYNNDDEPAYYADFGERISKYGELLDKEERRDITPLEIQRFSILEKEIPIIIKMDKVMCGVTVKLN